MATKEDVTKEKKVSCGCRPSGANLFWGTLLFFWGSALLLKNYFAIDLMENFIPFMAIILGFILIFSSIKR